MELTYKLEEMFPTEESRFAAYKKWIVISAVFGPILGLTDSALEYFLRIAERSYYVPESVNSWIAFLSILSIIGFFFTLASFYICFYISWKSNVVKTFFKMLLGIVIGTAIMAILTVIFPPLSLIVPIIGLSMNWERVKRYWNSNDRFVKDNLKLMGMFFLGFIVIIVGLVVSVISSTRYQFNSSPFILSVLISIFLLFIWPPVYSISVFDRERELATPFYKAYYQFNMTGFFILFSIIALTASIHHNFFDGNGIVDDLMGDFSDPTMVGSEHIYSATPDMTTTHIADIPDAGYIHSDTGVIHDAGVNYVNQDATSFMAGTDVSHTDIASDYSHVDGTFAFSGPDLMDGNFMNVYGGTNMADISHIQHNPYMIFNDPSVHGNFQICDPSGMPQMTVSNGSIVNSEYAVIGYVHTDAVSGITTYTDINNNPLYSVDSHGQMFSGNQFIGHTVSSGNETVIRDMHDNLVARYDKLTNTWFDAKTSKPISQIKPM